MTMSTLQLGRVDFLSTYAAMQAFTAHRTETAASPQADVIWLCEHPPTFTQGLAGKAEHVLHAADIPVVPTNRGGQVTYHGPGQVVAYPLVDLKRAGYFVKEYVYRLEEAVIRTLLHFGVTGHRVMGAPGIYVRLDDPIVTGLGKIAALGIKVSRHCTYHGLALTVAMDLEPFSRIHPCGYSGLRTVDLFTIGVQTSWEEAAAVLGRKLASHLAP